MIDKEGTVLTQAEAVINSIIEYITSHNLKPGDRLPSERELAELFHVSRPAIREASRALCVMNIVEIRSHSGMYVASFESNSKLDFFKIRMQAGMFDVKQLYDLRTILETECIALAVKNITDEQIEQIGTLLENVSINDPAGFAEADSKMHRIIYKATLNRPLQLVMEMIGGWSLMGRSYTNSFKEVRMIVHNDHRDIYAALRLRSEERCRASMRRHIEHLQIIDDISINAARQQYSTLLSNSTWDNPLD